ncbi:MAG: adenylate kinase [Neisseriales bacterium]|nr:MAG: adenylate kinase [Neisseriales bacterium]
MKLILLGPPGAGKGTQSHFIQTQYGILQISTGDILRQAIRHQTPLGKIAKETVDKGQLVTDDVVIGLMLTRIAESDCQTGFLLDGFPRNLAQALALKKAAITMDYVIEIAVPDQVLVNRLAGRRIHPASGRTYHTLFNPPRKPDQDDLTGEPLIQRPDDEETTIKERLSVYHNETKILVDFYQNEARNTGKPCYQRVDGTQPIEVVKHTIFQVIGTPSL